MYFPELEKDKGKKKEPETVKADTDKAAEEYYDLHDPVDESSQAKQVI